MFDNTGKLVRNKRDNKVGIVLREFETGQVQVLESITPHIINTHDSWETLELIQDKKPNSVEIKVGEYVRTTKGIIAKCIQEKADRYIFDRVIIEEGYYNNYQFKDIPERANIIKLHSTNLLDIIELGDFVNGYKVISNDGVIVGINCNKPDYESYLFVEQIDNVYTKERFHNDCYKVR